jgi:asparagine synthase (glutamine-hydrolysing)
MCGIAGILRNSAANTKQDITHLIKNLNHRGPDDYGFFINFKGNVAIGNSRLAIQDLSKKGKQPIISRCGRYIIVFNGEIYNFKEIKKNLSQIIINSDTDTEVLLNYFILKGPKILNELKGFFSFAIWDQKKTTILRKRTVLRKR